LNESGGRQSQHYLKTTTGKLMRRQASTGSWIAAAIVVIVLIGAGVWLVRRAMQPEEASPPAEEMAAPATSRSAAAPIQHPIAQVEAAPAGASTAPLPALDQSDDNVLAAPELATPPALLPSKGQYVFADPALEARSAGQRLLLRTGPANEAKIKARLRTIRGLLVGQHLQPAAASSAPH
jgi:hypothetical protein